MRTLMAVFVTLFAACGSGSVALDDYLDEIRDARCRYLVKCGEIEDLETCRKVNVGGLGGPVALPVLDASIRAAVDSGAIEYDGESVRACLEAFATRSCDGTSRSNRAVPDACLAAFTGTLHDGAACALDAECISLRCEIDRSACDVACCTGTCAGDVAPARAKLGESCQATRCEDALFCDEGTAMCVALKRQGGFCAVDAECDFGLYCSAAGECTAGLPALGEPCTGACRDDGTTCSPASRVCVAVALAGQACSMSADCSPIYYCDATKRCSAGPGLGEPCTVAQRCGDDRAFCDAPVGEAMGTCALPKADGSPCQLDAHCESQHCDPMVLTCGPEPVCI